MERLKKIALVAHDERKLDLLDWVNYNFSLLSKHELYATGTTGKLISGGLLKLSMENLS